MYPHSNEVSYVHGVLLTGKCSGLMGLAVGVHYVCTPQEGSQHLHHLPLLSTAPCFLHCYCLSSAALVLSFCCCHCLLSDAAISISPLMPLVAPQPSAATKPCPLTCPQCCPLPTIAVPLIHHQSCSHIASHPQLLSPLICPQVSCLCCISSTAIALSHGRLSCQPSTSLAAVEGMISITSFFCPLAPTLLLFCLSASCG
jgi:hypothetical protein